MVYQGPKSDHFDGKKFFMPGGPNNAKSFLTVLKWQITADRKEWPAWTENTKQNDFSKEPAAGEHQVHFVNHATIYVRTSQGAFVTDPLWSLRASPVQWAGPKRVRPPGVQLEALPKLDFVLVSHNHYDHLDEDSLMRLKQKYDPQFFVALGDGALLKKRGITKVTEMDWFQSAKVGEFEIIYVPAQHWSARGVLDRNESLWGGYIVRSQGKQIYFAGDSGYGPVFKDIHTRYGDMDISFLPIGAYEPRWFMEEMHMNPDDAVKAHVDLKSKRSLGMHFGTFQLTDEGIDEPAKDLQTALRKVSDVAPFVVPDNGDTFHW